jgi:C4-dicarboxylate transporter, DctM subunit
LSQTIVILGSTAAAGALFAIGTPIVLCMGFWTVAISYFGDALPLSNIGHSAIFGLKIFALLAMPLFILTGDVFRAGGIARQLTDFSRAAFRFVPGNLAVATTIACGCFAAISGSNAATTASMGRIMIPEMLRSGYDRYFAAATAAAGGVVGVIIPPSLIFIIYGIVLGVSPGDLFIAGIIPGVMMVAAMATVATLVSRRNQWEAPTKVSGPEVVRAAWGAKLGFLGIGIALAGIFAGLFSPTEIAGVVVVYGVLAGLLVTGELKIAVIPRVLLESATINGLIAPIVAFAIILQETFVAVGIPGVMESLLAPFVAQYWSAVLVAMLIVLFAGTFLESVPAVLIFAPILAPFAVKAGVDPIHFGIIFCVGTAIGFITPPYGLNLFVASGISRLPYMPVALRALPYLGALLAIWALVAVFPSLSLVLLGR